MLCWSYRWRIACLVDDGRAPQGKLRRHIETCPSCRAYLQSQQQVSTALSQTPDLAESVERQRLSSWANFSDKQGLKQVWRFPRLRRSLPTGAIAAGLLLATLIGIKFLRKAPDQPPVVPPVVKTVRPPSDVAVKWIAGSVARMESPYGREMQLLASDAEGAARFLAQRTINPLSFSKQGTSTAQ